MLQEINKEEELEEGKKVWLGTALSGPNREAIILTLKDRITTFAWKVKDIKGIDLAIITHKLNVNLEIKLVQ